jgi:hypothetical protein
MYDGWYGAYIDSELPISYSYQPKVLDYETETVEENTMNFNIFICALLCIFMLTILSLSKTRKIVHKIDFYSLNHNYDEGKAMYIQKTFIGGIFTIAFIFAAISVVFNMLLSYSIDNIREIKGLVPNFTVEQDYKDVIFI